MKKKYQNVRKMFGMIWTFEPRYFLCVIPALILSSLSPFIYIYFPKLFIEQLTDGSPYHDIVRNVLFFTAIILFVGIVNSFISNKKSFYIDSFTKKIQLKTGSITMQMQLSDMEGAEFGKKLLLANNAGQIVGMENVIFNMVSGAITIIGLASIIVRLDIMFVILVCMTLGVKVVFVRLTFNHKKKRRGMYADIDRTIDYLNNTAYTNHGASKEIRINSLREWFMSKVKGARNRMLKLQYEDFRKYAVFEIISAVIAALQSLVVLIILAIRTTNGTTSIADFTMYFSAVTVLTEKLSGMVESIGEYNRIQLSVDDYDMLLNYENPKNRETVHEATFGDIVFENVSFKYPGTDRFVLNNINLRIKAGEKVTVVGENGAGKSTLIKLLCRFYRPTSGRITMGGHDIFSIDDEMYNVFLAAVFQDYRNFYFSIRENVSLREYGNDEETSLLEAGLKDLLARLPDGADTYVGRLFNPNGIELSGGEGQKLAVARALYRDPSALILDEPTASLDPKAEREIYDNFLRQGGKKTIIYVSHRLASSLSSDKVVVLKDGIIVEQGSHKELMDYGGEYAKMFRIQSSSYSEAGINL